jgi:hypothetical protein
LKIFNSLSSKAKDSYAIALIAVLVLIFMWRIVVTGQVMIPIDTIYRLEPWKSELPQSAKIAAQIWNPTMTDEVWAGYPAYQYALEARRSGEIFWDPTILAGTPMMARGALVINPIYVMLSFILPLPDSLNWTKILHLFLAGFFTYLFLRELGAQTFGALVGAFAFSYNAYLIDWLSITFFFSTMVWMPLIFWGIERAIRKQDWRWVLISSVGFTIQIITGYILYPFYAAITILLFAAYRSVLVWFDKKNIRSALEPVFFTVAALGVGTLLTAPQLLPTIQLFINSVRTAPIGAGSYLNLNAHLIRFIAPLIYGNSISGQTYFGPYNYPETSIYFGVLPLLFIPFSLFSRHKRIAWGLTAIGLLTLLGVYYSGLRQVVLFLYPFYLNTFPARIFFIVAFCGAITAGLGADAAAGARPKRTLWIMSLVAASLAAYLVYRGSIHEDISETTIIYARNLILPVIWLIISAGIFFLWGASARSSEPLIGIALALIVADLFSLGINHNSTFDKELIFPDTISTDFLSTLNSKNEQPYRVLTVNSGGILPGVTTKLYHQNSISGYTSWTLLRYAEYAGLSDFYWSDGNQVHFQNCCDKFLNALNIKYLYVRKNLWPTDLGIFDLWNGFPQAHPISSAEGSFARSNRIIQGVERPVLYMYPPARVTYQLLVDKPMVLKTTPILFSTAGADAGNGAIFEIYIKLDGDSPEKRVYSHYLKPDHTSQNRLVDTVAIDLSDYQGRWVSLSLMTLPGAEDGQLEGWAGWINPQIIDPTATNLKLIHDGPNRIYENQKAFPRAWIVHKVTQVRSGELEAVKKQLEDPQLDLAFEAVIEVINPKHRVIRLAPRKDYLGEKALITSYSSNSVTISAQLEKPGLLILSDVIYPEWKVYVDGVEQPLIATNLVMRGVFVEEGEHEVEFTYRPMLFYAGSMIALLSIVLVVTALLMQRYRIIRVHFSQNRPRVTNN